MYAMKIKDIFKWASLINSMLLTPIVALSVLEESMTTVELNGDSQNPDFPKPRYVAEGSGMEFFFMLYTGKTKCFAAAKYYKEN